MTKSLEVKLKAGTAKAKKVAAVSEEELLSFIERSMKVYGTEVNLERSVPDYRDGLKPVGRRVLWAMHQLSTDKVKAARVVGDTMGKYHPHGDCLRGDTLVYTLDGAATKISDMIGKGKKWVLSWDQENCKYVPALAHSWRIGQSTRNLYKVHLSDGTSIQCTGNHPFLGCDSEWIQCKDLVAGQELKGSNLEVSDYYSVLDKDLGRRSVHAIVADSVHGGVEDGEIVHHVSEVKSDNRPKNLRVLTRSDHALEHRENFEIGLSAVRKGESPAHNGVFVMKVTKRTLAEEEDMYDFTVDKYQNMAVLSDKEFSPSNTLVVVHNSSIYGMVVNMVTSPANPLKGVGNWGTLVDPPAAMRYPMVGLSTYGATFFGKNYTSIIDKVPNFDRSNVEPLVLPSLLPNLFLNGTSGIGVGVTTDIPSFTPASVLKLMIRMLSGENLDASDFARSLEFFYQYGGRATNTPLNKKAILALFEGNKGTVEWESPLEVNEAKKEITLWKFAPDISPVTMIEGRVDKAGKKVRPGVKDWEAVGRVTASKGLSYIIRARRDLNMNEFKQLVEKVRKLTTVKTSYAINVTERALDLEAGEGKYRVKFINCTIPELFLRWLRWRCKLEARSLDWQIAQLDTAIQFLELLIYASSNLDVIFKALRTATPDINISKGLKITLDQANQILNLQVRRLSKLDQDKLKGQLAEAKDKMAVLKKKRKDPPGQVKLFLESCLSAFTLHSQFAGTNQWDLKTPRRLAEPAAVAV